MLCLIRTWAGHSVPPLAELHHDDWPFHPAEEHGIRLSMQFLRDKVAVNLVIGVGNVDFCIAIGLGVTRRGARLRKAQEFKLAMMSARSGRLRRGYRRERTAKVPFSRWLVLPEVKEPATEAVSAADCHDGLEVAMGRHGCVVDANRTVRKRGRNRNNEGELPT